MSEKHFVISLEKGIDKQEIMDELSRDTTSDVNVDSNIIPDRQVQTVNNRPSSKRMFEMALTEDEVSKLRNDSRVGDINEPLVWDDEWLDYERSGTGNWARTPGTSNRNNWGLLRHIEQTNGWGSSVGSNRADKYSYHLDGSGVDFINQEGSIARPDHVQWQDSNGQSRYQQFQWNTLPNMGGMGTVSYSGTGGGHATHCCGTVVSKDYGWATGANIYSLGLNSHNQSYWFDAIKEFHKAKAPDPFTGVKRPTVINASWGYRSTWSNITNIYFRGTNTGTTAVNRSYGMIGDTADRFNAQLYNLMAEVEEMQDEGVIYCKSAGNQRQKLCGQGDIDYNNYITKSSSTGGISAGQPVYYNRGAGNIGPDTIVVGNIDSYLFNGQEATQTGSDKGPRVDVWAAGTNIISSYNNSASATADLTGTSMATPQVSGMTCLLLQMNPGMTPAQVRSWWHNNAVQNLLYVGPNNENDPATFFNNDRNLMGGVNRIAYFPYNAHRNLEVQVQMTHGKFG